jgi:signal transduction histidine kinase
MSSANPKPAQNPKLRHWWRSSSLRIALISGLSMWLLNSLLVLGLYDFTLRALVGDIGRSIDLKIENRLAGWPKQLPKHAGVTSWLYRQLAVEIADLQDCVALADADGELQLSNINRSANPEFRYHGFYTATFTGHRWQPQNRNEDATCLVTERILTDGGSLIYGVPFDSYLLTIQQLNKLRIWGLFLTAALSLIVTLSVTLRQLRRLRVIYQACERVASGDLRQRIEVTGRDDDLDHIAAVINHMLDQIAQLMEGVREVSDAIAHDLKTPLARLRGQLELLLSISDRSDDAIDAVIAEADQVLAAFNALLRIAQLEQGTRRQAFIHFDFNSVLAQMRDIYDVVFADKNIRFEISAAPDGAPVYGDRELWLQTVSNLLDNAYKYTPAGGRVTIALAVEAQTLHLQISDSGPGIPAGEYKNVFKRFYRLDKHRSQKGTGLGLSLVAAVCKVHKATIELSNRNGLVIDIHIPVDQHADETADGDK